MASASEIERHHGVLNEALRIYETRDKVREGHWQTFPNEENIRQAESKVSRAKASLEKLDRLDDDQISMDAGERESMIDALEQELFDSCLDGINFLVFTLRSYRDSRL